MANTANKEMIPDEFKCAITHQIMLDPVGVMNGDIKEK